MVVTSVSAEDMGFAVASEGWFYRWTNESPLASGARAGAASWQPHVFRKTIPDRGQQNVVLLRYTVPELPWARPGLFFTFVEFAFEAWVDDRLIGQFGQVEADGNCNIESWVQHHILPLKPSDAGKTLYVRICSPVSNIGIVDVPLIGNVEELHFRHVKDELILLVAAVCLATCSLIALYFFSRRTSQALLLDLSAIAMSLAIICLYHTEFRLDFIRNYSRWTWIMAVAGAAFPYFLLRYLIQMVGQGWKGSLRILRGVSLLCLGIVVLLAAVDMSWKFQKFVVLPFFVLQILSFTACILHLLPRAWSGEKDSILLLAGLLSMLVSLLPHILYEFAYLPTTHFYFPLGSIVFIVGLTWIAGDSYQQVFRDLQRYSESLESMVAERTCRIELANQKALENERTIALLEMERARLQEREEIFRDIHDHVGADLVDLQLELKRFALEDRDGRSQRVHRIAARLMQSVKSCVDRSGDLELLRSEFLSGLHMLALRRYQAAGRPFTLDVCEDSRQLLGGDVGPLFGEHFFHAFMELVTNDLKYGQGHSICRLRLREAEVILFFGANSLHNGESHGKGNRNILQRLMILRTRVEAGLCGDRYEATWYIPSDVVAS